MPTNRKLLQIITKKWHIKVLSVAAALLLMVFHRMNTQETRFFLVPLQIEANENLVPASLLTQNIKVRVRGEAGSIFLIQEDDIEAFINLERYTAEGSYRVPVQVRRKSSAFIGEPVQMTAKPAEFIVRLEQRSEQ